MAGDARLSSRIEARMLPPGVDEAIGDGDGDGSGPCPPAGRAPAPPPDGPPLCPLERARLFLGAVASDPGRFDGRAAPGLRAVAHDAGRARLRCEMPLCRAVTNRFGGLHGGAAATLVDVVATAALAALGDRAGVSLSIVAHYHRPVLPLGPAAAGAKGGARRAGGAGGGGGGVGGDGGGGGDGGAPPRAQEAEDGDGGGTMIVVDAEVVKVGKHVATVDVAIRTRRRRRQRRGGGEEEEGEDEREGEGEDGDGGRGGDQGADEDGPLLISGTHVKALVARSDIGALFDRAAGARGRSRL